MPYSQDQDALDYESKRRVKDIAGAVIDLIGTRVGKRITPLMVDYLGEEWHKTASRKVNPTQGINRYDPDSVLNDPAFFLKVFKSYWHSPLSTQTEWKDKKVIKEIHWLLDLRNDHSHQANYCDVSRTVEAIDRSQRVLMVLEKINVDENLKRWRDELDPSVKPVTSKSMQDEAKAGSIVEEPSIVKFTKPQKTAKIDSLRQSVWKKLDDKQRSLITNRSKSGYRRVRGSAGSGKTIVAAARAVEVAAEGKSVLVVLYNRTMAARMRSLVEECILLTEQHDALSRIQIYHIHALFKKIIEWGGQNVPIKNPETSFELYNKTLFESAKEAVKQEAGERIPYFDCIIVDEGQDFSLPWWQFLRTICEPGTTEDGLAKGEMLLIADATQDLYGCASAWTEESMQGAGFRGDWSRLDESYRMPPNLVPLANDFVERYFPDKTLTNSPLCETTRQLEFGATFEFEWINAGEDPVKDLLEALHRKVSSNERRCSVIQASTNKRCREILQRIRPTNFCVRHTLDKKGHNTKNSFSLREGEIGVITPHSFKGFEAPIVFLLIEKFHYINNKHEVYTALTRVLRHEQGSMLTVVNTTHELHSLGERWEALMRGEKPKASGTFF